MSEYEQYPPPPPPTPMQQYDFIRPLAFVFEDPRWLQKLSIGALFTASCFLLIGIPFVSGYIAQLMRNVMAGEPRPLPEWNDLGAFFTEGLRLTAISLIYSIPFVAIMGFLFVPGLLVGAAAGEKGYDAAAGLLGLAWSAMYPLSMALTFFLPAPMLLAVADRRFDSAFDFGRIFRFIRANFGPYLLAFLGYFLASMVSQFGCLLCCVGIFFTMFWSALVYGAAFAQAYRLSTVK